MPRRAHEHVVDERLRCERREPAVEARDDRARDAERREMLELRAERREPRRRRAAREELARMRIEREHRRRQREILRGFDEPGEHRLVPAMDAVEIADRQRDGTVGRRRQAANHPHGCPRR